MTENNTPKDWETAKLSPEFSDPVTDANVPWVVEYDENEPDPVPPADRTSVVEADGKVTGAAQVPYFSDPEGGADK